MTSSLATLFVDFSNFLLVLNCSTNFWVFFFWGKRFRRCCLYMIASSVFGRALHKWLHVVDLPVRKFFILYFKFLKFIFLRNIQVIKVVVLATHHLLQQTIQKFLECVAVV